MLLKKVISLVVLMAIIFSFTACDGKKKPNGSQNYVKPDFSLEEKLTITWMIPTQQSKKLKETPVIQKMMEDLNINLEIEEKATSQHTENIGLKTANHTLPHVVSWVTVALGNVNGPAGAFLDLSLYLDDMPTIKNLVNNAIDQNPDNKNILYNVDGQMFSMPRYMTDPINIWDFSYNKAEFAAVGYENPQTMQDVKNALIALKAKYPNSYPLTFRNIPEQTVAKPLQLFVESFTEAQASTLDFLGFIESKDEFKFALEVDGYKEAVAFFAELYTTGLIDPAYVTNDEDIVKNKFKLNKSFMMADYVGGWTGRSVAMKELNYKLSPLAIPKANSNAKQVYGRKQANFDTISATALNSELANDPVRLGRVLLMLDYLYSEQFYNMQWYHPDVAIKNNDGTYSYKDAVFATTGDTQSLVDTYFPWSLYACFIDTQDERPDPSKLSEYINYRDNVLRAEDAYYGRLPTVSFTPAMQEAVNNCEAVVKEQFRMGISDFVEGKRSMSEWDSFVNQLKKAGADNLIEYYNTAYRTQKA